MYKGDHSRDSDVTGVKDDNSSLPSWIRLLESPTFAGHDVTGSGVQAADDDDDEGDNETNDGTVWYHSPILNTPVTGYYNRNTGSNRSLNTTHLSQPIAALPQSHLTQSQPITTYPESHTGQWNALETPKTPNPVVDYSGEKNNQWQSSKLDVSAVETDQPITGFPSGKAGQWLSSINEFSHRATLTHLADQQNSQGYHGDQGVYSELAHPPWLNHKDIQDQGQSYPLEKPGLYPDDLHYGNDLGYHNNAYSPSVDDSAGSLPGRPDVHRPEEYLSGLKGAEPYPVQFAHAPCGRCTRIVTSLLVVMGLAVVALAAALTASVLTRKDSSAAQEGHAVVRASMSLRILNKNFTSEMTDPASAAFRSVAVPYGVELDRLFLKSPLSSVYRGNKVISLSPGSIKTETELLFLDTQKGPSEAAVQNVITSAARASQWAQSDAREVGDFVVCSDCVTVTVEHTRVRELPSAPRLPENGGAVASSTVAAPAKVTPISATTATVTDAGTIKPDVTTAQPDVITPMVQVSGSSPFVTDGHYVIACDVTKAVDWLTVEFEFTSDNSSSKQAPEWFVTLDKSSPTTALVVNAERSRIHAYPSTTSSDSVGLVVNVTSVTCADRGAYSCRVTLKDGRQLSGSDRVEVLELPSTPVIGEKTVSSSKQWNSPQMIYSCTAHLGFPPGKLILQAETQNGSLIHVTSGQTTKGDNCDSPVQVSADRSELPDDVAALLCLVETEHAGIMPYPPVTRFNMPKKLEIHTKSTSLDDGLAAVRCRLSHTPSWSRMTLYKMTSSSSSSPASEIATLSSDGTFAWADLSFRHRSHVTRDVTGKTSEFTVLIHSLKCADEGVYTCAVQDGVVLTEVQQELTVTARPTKPELLVPTDMTETTLRPVAIQCTANVGHPAGNLLLAIKRQNEADFRDVPFNEQTSTTLTCNTAVTGKYYAGALELGNGTSVSCRVEPHESLRHFGNTTERSGVFSILEDSLCLGLQEGNVTHPGDCRYVIYCSNDVIANVTQCPDGKCFDGVTGKCSNPFDERPKDNAENNPCYPSLDKVTSPDLRQCTSYIQCEAGTPVTQHCPAGHLYVSGEECTDDVTKSYCYAVFDTTVGVRTALALM